MGNTVRSTALVAVMLVAAGCATTGEPGKRAEPGAGNPEIVSLNRAIGKEQDAAALASLLFKRGHAYLVDAELFRGPSQGEDSRSGSFELPGLLLGAIRDFEDIAANFPQSAEAPEALFHLGLIYDYPNLASFEIALNYYRRTIEKYPGTDSAGKAQLSIEKIEAIMRDVGAGRHGTP